MRVLIMSTVKTIEMNLAKHVSSDEYDDDLIEVSISKSDVF
jgi:hypothetical protein